MERLNDSELRVMEVIWREGACAARLVADELFKAVGWNKNTSYTLIKRLIDKGALSREEPGFVCHPLVSRQAVQQRQSGEILDKLFGGSASKLFAALVDSGKLKGKEIEELRRMIDQM